MDKDNIKLDKSEDAQASRLGLDKLGVDLAFLRDLPRGGHGREWPGPWRVACEVLFINGISPGDITNLLDGPDRRTIYEWAEAGRWLERRDAHIRAIAEKVIEQTGETQATIFQRHLKSLRVVQNSALAAILHKHVEGKSLEGVITALIAAIKAERGVLGLTNNGETPKDAGVQSSVTYNLNVAPEQREALFELYRQKFEVESRLNELTSRRPPPPPLLQAMNQGGT